MQPSLTARPGRRPDPSRVARALSLSPSQKATLLAVIWGKRAFALVSGQLEIPKPKRRLQLAFSGLTVQETRVAIALRQSALDPTGIEALKSAARALCDGIDGKSGFTLDQAMGVATRDVTDLLDTDEGMLALGDKLDAMLATITRASPTMLAHLQVASAALFGATLPARR